MMFNQQLYHQYKQNKYQQQPNSNNLTRKHMLQIIVDWPDNYTVTLENSVGLLRQLGIVEEIKSVEHIVVLMENRKSEGIGWESEGRQLWECRLIYFMWHIIAHQQIQMRDFKELIIILSNPDQNRPQIVQQLYGQKQEITELILTWDRLVIQGNGHSPSRKINDISIIKTKNEGSFGSSNQNLSAENASIPSLRNSFDPKTSRQSKSRVSLQKSYVKKSAKTTLDRNNSTGRYNSKRSQCNSVTNYIAPTQEINFFNQAQMLTPQDQKKLVERLYDCSKYQTREQIKQHLEEERKKSELNQCTFKPMINKVVYNQKQQAKSIKGFDKAIDRIKQGYKKTKELKENLEYRSSKQLAPLTSKLTQCMPPKFNSKPMKQQKLQLFELKFSLGRMCIPIKVRQSDNLEQLVDRIGRIYSLKLHQKDYIRQGIISSLEKYKQAILQKIEQHEA